jgi:hypothetical protein
MCCYRNARTYAVLALTVQQFHPDSSYSEALGIRLTRWSAIAPCTRAGMRRCHFDDVERIDNETG